MIKKLKVAECINKEEAFKEAYLKAGGGRPYTYIYRIREELNWPREMFDETMEELARQQVLELQGGNPSNLSEEQKNNSFMDNGGYLRISVTWRG